MSVALLLLLFSRLRCCSSCKQPIMNIVPSPIPLHMHPEDSPLPSCGTEHVLIENEKQINLVLTEFRVWTEFQNLTISLFEFGFATQEVVRCRLTARGQCGLGSKRCYWGDRAAPHPRCTPGTLACPYPPVNMAAATNSSIHLLQQQQVH